MSELPTASLVVLVEESVLPEFRTAVREFGERWRAASGFQYRFNLQGARLEVDLLLEALAPPPEKHVVDDDLFELACALQDAAGAPWSSAALRALAEQWGHRPAGVADV